MKRYRIAQGLLSLIPNPADIRHSLRTTHWLALFITVAVSGLLAIFTPGESDALIKEKVTQSLAVPDRNFSDAQVTDEPHTPGQWQHITVGKGDNLAVIFSRLNINARQWYEILKSDKQAKQLTRLNPGEKFDIRVDEQNQLQELIYKKNRTFSLNVERIANGFKVTPIHKDLETRVQHARAAIQDSLFVAGMKAGLSDSLIMELVGIFGWDIDFAQDIRSNDSFTFIYEEKYLDGEKVGNGNILAAEFTNQGKVYRAVRYTDASGRTDYYTPEGRSMRKAFLRTPVSYSRISSRFGKRRHPILNRIRAHRGVDYSAPRGTPIKAAGDGKIIYRGRKGGYGKTIVIRHGGKYSTLYAHMSHYKRGLRSGKHVKQGQVIGYIGSTGLATGPHLHYEFRVHGVHRNPLTVRPPDARSINKRYKADYLAYSQGFLAQLDVLNKLMLASSDDRPDTPGLN